MKVAMIKALSEWESLIHEGEVKKVAIYANPIKVGEYVITLCRSSMITFENRRKQIDCMEIFYTVGQNDSSVNPNSDINRLQIAVHNLSLEYEKKMATAISEFIEEAGIPPKGLDDFS